MYSSWTSKTTGEAGGTRGLHMATCTSLRDVQHAPGAPTQPSSTEKSACLRSYRPGPEGRPLGKDRLPGMNSLLRPPTLIVARPSSRPATICTTSPVAPQIKGPSLASVKAGQQRGQASAGTTGGPNVSAMARVFAEQSSPTALCVVCGHDSTKHPHDEVEVWIRMHSITYASTLGTGLHLPSAHSDIIGKAPVQATVKDPPIGRHGYIVAGDLQGTPDPDHARSDPGRYPAAHQAAAEAQRAW